jgi:hypothetical protein
MCRSGWAWEWLRHNSAYRQSSDIGAFTHRRIARQTPLLTVIELRRPYAPDWGLCFAEDPERPFHRAAVFWEPAIDASVCPVAAVPARNGPEPGLFDLTKLKVTSTVLRLPSGEEHVLLCNGTHALQLHVVEGTVLDGPVRLAYVLQDFGRFHEQRLIIERLGTILKRRRFPDTMFTPEPGADRLLLTLKAINLEAAGLSHAAIAAELYPSDTSGGFATDWRRSRVRRLLDTGHALINGDYLKLLARPIKNGRQAA